jgi:hypothetical protein
MTESWWGGVQMEELQRRVTVLQAVVGPAEEDEGGAGEGGDVGRATAALQERSRRLAADVTTCKRQLLEREAALDEARRRNAGKSPLGDAESSLGDAKSSLGDAESSLG